MFKVGAAVVVGLALLLLVPLVLVVPFLGEPDSGDGGSGCGGVAVTIDGEDAAEFSSEQQQNAATILGVGRSMNVPEHGLVTSLATALQESGLQNLDYGDRDSLGLFQQRPSQGWGTPEQVTDPEYAARKFFTSLLEVPGWEQLPVTVASQRVQASAFPNAYAKWEPAATALVAAAGGGPPTGTGAAPGQAGDGCVSSAGLPLPPGEVGDFLGNAQAKVGKPYIWGGTGPAGYDCSGLIVASWREAGFVVPVRTASQMWDASQEVAAGQEQPGDMIFSSFGSRVSGPGHVAVVVEPGTVVEAPYSGVPVRVRPYTLDEGDRVGRFPEGFLQATGTAS